ncbi:MAG TPA: protein phosphatase 2C domain-containing protein [Ktedonobacteraceae bacterium]
MQAEVNILQRITRAYVAHRSVRLLGVTGVLGAGVLLFQLAGGFPPSAWRLLAQALPRISGLMAAHAQATLLALLGLILLSLTLLMAWAALLWLCWRMLAYWRYERRELRYFAEDAIQAHSLADEEEAFAAPFTDEADDDMAGVRGPHYGRPLATYSRYPLAVPEPEDAAFPDWQGYEDTEDEAEIGHDRYADIYEEEKAMEQPAALEPGPAPDALSAHPRRTLEPQLPAAPVVQAASAHISNLSALSTQPMRPVSLSTASAASLAYGQPAMERTNPGRVVPFIAPANGHMHPPTGYYSHVSLPTVAPAPMPLPVVRQPATRLVVSTGLDAGLKRKDRPNEDSLLALQNMRLLHGNPCPVGLFVVADGMGGHSNGQEASRMVIQALSRTVVPSIIYGPTDDNYAELLAEGVHHANLEVYQRNRQEKANMGTTIAAALVIDATAYVVSAGDSRVYLYRSSSGLSQVTRDHSTVARMVENGLILPEDVYTHPRRNEIYRSLGHHASEDLDSFILALLPEDVLLLCSDGLWEMVRDTSIEQIIASTLRQPAQVSAALVQAALDGGGKDNISVIVVYVKAEEETQAAWAAG